jgi:hypothetical protein
VEDISMSLDGLIDGDGSGAPEVRKPTPYRTARGTVLRNDRSTRVSQVVGGRDDNTPAGDLHSGE